MIKVLINETDKINSIEIKGHSNYASHGSDIVCASVSSISITTVNAIIRIDSDSINYKDEDGYLLINIFKHSDTIDKLIDNMINLLEELERKYNKHIEIRRCHKWD